MRRRPLLVGLAAALLTVPTAGWAILIETSPGVWVGGFLVSDDGKKLVVADGPGSDAKKTTYDRAKINFRQHVDKEALAKLDSSNPKAYWEYAQELAVAVEKGDPEAKYFARRLYLIAAYLDPQKFGQGALVRLSALAETTVEARKCLAMAFLLDPKADPKMLKLEPVKPAPVSKDEILLLENLLKVLQHYAMGQTAKAKALADKLGMDKVFREASGGMMDLLSFKKRCDDATCKACTKKNRATCTVCGGTGVIQTIPEQEMRVLVRTELWVIDRLSGGGAGDAPSAGGTSWSSVLQRRQAHPVPTLSWETIIDFNPSACHYRDGKWVLPKVP